MTRSRLAVRFGVLAAGVGVVLALAGVAPAPATAEVSPETRVAERVLVVAIPEVSWADLADADLPAIDRFAATAALANVATRMGRLPASTTDAYLTMGAGTRAISEDLGTIFDRTELYGSDVAGDVFSRRTGRTSDADVLHLDIAQVDAANARTDYGATLGLLGDVLAAHDVTRSVVGNADLGVETAAQLRFRRPAGALVMTGAGEVPSGVVAADRVLRADPTAPWGVVLDEERVVEEVASLWNAPGRRVTVVEASDLSRAAEYASSVSPAEAATQRRAALESTDRLVSALLDDVDPARDAVMLIAPVARSADTDLSVVALSAPGLEPGLLESATTRRTGFVQLADVAPTVLDLFGLPTPEGMEGRPFRRAGTGGTFDDRVDRLVDSAREAELRDRAIPYATTVLALGVTLLAFAYLFRARLPSRVQRALPTAAVAVLALLPATYASALASVQNGFALVVSILVPAAVLTVVLEVLRRRHPFFAVGLALAIIMALFAIDLASGARLQLNTLFGYSTAVAGRFAGLGNLAFGFLAAATLLLAVTVWEAFHGRRGLYFAIAILTVGVLLDGLPMLGGDVGGALAMVPAFGLAAMVLAGRRVRLWHVVAWCLAGGVTVLAFGLLDFARPRDERTHLARFIERVSDRGADEISRFFERRWEASIGSPRTAMLLIVALGVAFAVQFAFLRVSSGRGPRVARAGRAVLVGLGLLAVIGLVSNDSGIAVPGVMLAVAVPVAVLRSDAWLGASP